jgi:hypothetical protein
VSTGDQKRLVPSPNPPDAAGMHHKLLRITITIVAAIFIAAHLWWPSLQIDSITLSLLVVGLLPWLAPIFKSIELPGGLKVETADREQKPAFEKSPATTQAPISAEPASSTSPTLYDSDARIKVLATLWRYQQLYFPNDPVKRWTFAVSPKAQDFPFYLRGVAQLVSEGLAAITVQDHNCMLTGEGMIYCKRHQQESGSEDTYEF